MNPPPARAPRACVTPSHPVCVASAPPSHPTCVFLDISKGGCAADNAIIVVLMYIENPSYFYVGLGLLSVTLVRVEEHLYLYLHLGICVSICWMFAGSICGCVRIYTCDSCVCGGVSVSVSVSVYLCIYVSMYLCIYVFMYLCIYVSMCLCVYVSIYLSVECLLDVSMDVCIR